MKFKAKNITTRHLLFRALVLMSSAYPAIMSMAVGFVSLFTLNPLLSFMFLSCGYLWVKYLVETSELFKAYLNRTGKK